MKNIIQFQSHEYDCRYIVTADACYLVAQEELEDALWCKNDRYISDDARNIDESVFCYIPRRILYVEDSKIKEYIKRYIL